MTNLGESTKVPIGWLAATVVAAFTVFGVLGGAIWWAATINTQVGRVAIVESKVDELSDTVEAIREKVNAPKPKKRAADVASTGGNRGSQN